MGEITNQKSEIYLAGGCFWGLQKYFDQKEGVIGTDVGYANGNIQNPTYEKVCSGDTNFIETVHIIYDKEKLSLTKLLEAFYRVIDPTSKDKQGNDRGVQYRAGIYYTKEEERKAITESMTNLQNQYDDPIVIEIKPLCSYYIAEDYHQKYLEKNKDGYCHIKSELFES